MKIKYKGPYQLIPAKDGDAGYDIATNEEKVIYGRTSAQFSTGLSMAIPKGYVGKVVSRSGLSFKHGIEVGAGIIDSGYRGEIKIHLHNFGDFPVQFKPGDRIAQIIILKHEAPIFELVDSLDETERGVNGFGHTGINNDHPFYKNNHENAKRSITEVSTNELIKMWNDWDDHFGSEECCPLEFHYEDIHAELNRRGEGKQCAV